MSGGEKLVTAYSLRLTVADHVDDRFYNLGLLPVEGPPEAVFARIPDHGHVHDCDHADACLVVDLLTDGWSIRDDREVSPEIAEQLFGRSVSDAHEDARRWTP